MDDNSSDEEEAVGVAEAPVAKPKRKRRKRRALSSRPNKASRTIPKSTSGT